jgi:hypothetical protein
MRLTAEEAFEHVWLDRHSHELRALYSRSIEGWEDDDDDDDEVLESPTEETVLPELEESGDAPSPESEPEETGDDESFYCALCTQEENEADDDEEMDMMYDQEEQELHDSVAGDGKLRSAAQLTKEVEFKRIENIYQGSFMSTAHLMVSPGLAKSSYFDEELIR